MEVEILKTLTPELLEGVVAPSSFTTDPEVYNLALYILGGSYKEVLLSPVANFLFSNFDNGTENFPLSIGNRVLEYIGNGNDGRQLL